MKPDLELQYNNRARIPEHPEIVARWAQESQAYRETRGSAGLAELNLPYGASPRQVVDVFLPDTDDQSLMTVFIHGGYWQLFEPSLFSHMARGANARNMPMALIGYDLSPSVNLATIVEQTKAACVFLWRRYQRRLVLTGHSAGGHLTACMIAADWRAAGADIPDLVSRGLAISGVFELAPLIDTSMNDKLRLDAESARQLSPINWHPPKNALIDAWVGDQESDEFLRQSRDFVSAWEKKGVGARYETVPGAHHFSVIHPLADPESRMTARLAELARPEQ